MKSSLFIATIVAASAFMFGFTSCANQSSNVASTTANPTDRTYTRHDLDNSGRRTTGEAIQALDPAATVSGR